MAIFFRWQFGLNLKENIISNKPPYAGDASNHRIWWLPVGHVSQLLSIPWRFDDRATNWYRMCPIKKTFFWRISKLFSHQNLHGNSKLIQNLLFFYHRFAKVWWIKNQEKTFWYHLNCGRICVFLGTRKYFCRKDIDLNSELKRERGGNSPFVACF